MGYAGPSYYVWFGSGGILSCILRCTIGEHVSELFVIHLSPVPSRAYFLVLS